MKAEMAGVIGAGHRDLRVLGDLPVVDADSMTIAHQRAGRPQRHEVGENVVAGAIPDPFADRVEHGQMHGVQRDEDRTDEENGQRDESSRPRRSADRSPMHPPCIRKSSASGATGHRSRHRPSPPACWRTETPAIFGRARGRGAAPRAAWCRCRSSGTPAAAGSRSTT